MTDFGLTEDLNARAKRFAISIVRMVGALPKSVEARVIAHQIVKAGTSLAANYRAACRGRSRAEFIAKLGTAVEEADETVFWLEIMQDTGIGDRTQVDGLLKEARELLAIFSASRHTAKRKESRPS